VPAARAASQARTSPSSESSVPLAAVVFFVRGFVVGMTVLQLWASKISYGQRHTAKKKDLNIRMRTLAHTQVFITFARLF
jgi:hypothetical protein